ncbi:Mitochondrial FAD carrier protein FLX1 [Cytospora mali]|uniref:Mitochondrial FAD carrier protein FLX1 n=1 Tax=Cytospora mali TaxID=578113 RepID=A0A194W633_CYTMA|nr:Mitochondrial FAD carrier protein FLX1 [Valsa mali]
MTDTNQGGKGSSSGAVEAIAGLSAGTLANLVGHPLEIVKTRLQIDQNKIGSSNSATMTSVALKLVRSEHPIATLYRGLVPNVIGGACSWGSFFTIKSYTERFLVSFKGNPTSTSSASALAHLSPADYFISATVAGLVTQALTNPIWVIKTRMVSSDRTSSEAFPNMWTGISKVYRMEGLKGFYSGLTMSLVGVSQGALTFAVYDPIKNFYLARQRGAAQQDISNGGDGGKDKLGFQATVVLSTTAKLIAQAAVYPYQVVRSRLQNHNADVRFGKGVRGVARGLWLEAGIRGFYKGLGTASIRMLPSTWVTFLVYENVKYYLPRYMSGEKQEEEL